MGLRPFGIRAMEAMRIEKSYKMVGQEMSVEYAALESGLERFVRTEKGDFIGRDGLLKWQKRGFSLRFCTLEISGVEDADALGNNPIYLNGERVGMATSGGYGFRLGKSLALGMIRPSAAESGTELEMDILGNRHRAVVIDDSPYDPQNQKSRG